MHSTTFVSEKVIEMEIGNCITNITYLVRELCLGDSIGCCPLPAKCFLERHFSSVLWLLEGDVQRITCSFIALAFDILASSCVLKLKVQ